MDVFICGVCHMGFHDIGKFVEHKNSLGSISCGHCTAIFHTQDELAQHALQEHAAEAQGLAHREEETPLGQSMEVDPSSEAGANDVTTAVDGATTTDSQTIVVTDGLSFEATENSVVSDIFACSLCQCFALSEEEMVNHVNECHQRSVSKGSEEAPSLYYRLQQLAPTVLTTPGEERQTLRVLPMDAEEPPTQPTTLHLVVETTSPPAPPKRRRGRPRKIDQMQRPVPAVVKPEEEPDTLLRGQDGLFHCTRCKRTFCKERHILGHRCMAKGDYVDNFEKKDEESGLVPDEEAKDADTTEDFRLHRTNEREPWARYRVRRGGYRGGRRSGISRGAPGSPGPESSSGPGEANKENLVGQDQAAAEKAAEGGTEVEELPPRKLHWREDPRHVPVFSRDEERLAFEEHLNRVDLSCVDHLYTQHQVAQEITCPPGTRPAPKEVCDLHVFSCNVCKKVFKTQSHMRLHCLIHTDLKPFTCHQCDFSTNAKGNLYTHMRKHTGNYFKCSLCDFRSCNRSHMAEHEATHSTVRQRCELCSNDYNTVKSLVNHVRKYHTSPAGKRYLATFQSKQLQNMAVLHICHLCNRKFKKKVDRDRHLFVHNVPEPPTAYQCGLCGYQASRRTYLENHYRKHRLVYVCSVCCGLHLSAKALRAHLQKEHIEKQGAASDEEPKPDSSIECFVAESGTVSTAEETVSDGMQATSEQDDCSEPTLNAAVLSAIAAECEAAEAASSSDATLESLFADSIGQSWYLPEPDGMTSSYANIPQELIEGSQESSSESPNLQGVNNVESSDTWGGSCRTSTSGKLFQQHRAGFEHLTLREQQLLEQIFDFATN